MACFSHFETAPLSANERIAEFLAFAYCCFNGLYGKELTDNNKCGLIWFVGNEKLTIA